MKFDIEHVLPILITEVADYKVPVVDLIAVQTHDPYRILVATILSARTKDETTAKAAHRLFKVAPDLAQLAGLGAEKIASLIYPVGFYKNKAAYLANLPGAVNNMFGGVIPDDVDKLTMLPGVGRKTANLVVNVAFGKPAICVDTHVHRIVNIWGYVSTKTPLETEMALRAKLPKKFWSTINSTLVAFGQGTCTPLRPHCDSCVIEQYCPKIGVTPRTVPGKRKDEVKNNNQVFISWNVNGLRAVEKSGFADIVREFDADIIALQEIKAHPDQLTVEVKNMEGYKSYWHPAQRKGYAGVAVYARKEPLRVLQGMGDHQYDHEGRVLSLEYDTYYFVNVYFPNAQHGLTRLDYKLQFNRDFQAFVDSLRQQKSVVICGDYNVAHKEIDLKNPKENEKNAGFSPSERAWMDEFIRAGYVDTFRMLHPEKVEYTWWSYRFNARARNIGWRIDYFCVDRQSMNRVKKAEILGDIMGSDHCPVFLEFA